MTNRRKVGTTSSHVALTCRATHVLQWPVQTVANPRGEANPKAGRSPDWGLQLDPMKSESLVIANQNVAVNTSRPCTHRPSHHGSGLRRVASLTSEDGPTV